MAVETKIFRSSAEMSNGGSLFPECQIYLVDLRLHDKMRINASVSG